MCIIEQIIGIVIIGICFGIGLLYVAPVTIKDAKQLIKEVFIDGKVDSEYEYIQTEEN